MTRRAGLRALAGCLLGGLAAAAAGCWRRRSPEQQVRDTLAALAQAVEDQDLDAIRALISDRYRDAEDHDRPEVIALLRVHFARDARIHVLARVTAVEVGAAAGEPARATVVAALASLPMKAVADVSRLQADVYRFELTLAREGAERWTVTHAAWEPARPGDLL